MDLVGLGERPPITSLETPETLHDRGFAYESGACPLTRVRSRCEMLFLVSCTFITND